MTHDPIEILSERVVSAMRAAFGDALPDGAEALIASSKNPQFGDYQANAAMPLGKALGMPPREAAKKIIEHLDVADLCDPMTEDSIAGPGFINFRLRDDALKKLLAQIDTHDVGIEHPESPKTIVVDLCGVNLAKQMHVGHLRATVIGDAIARVYERLGWNVIRQSHLGDWGLPIAMVTGEIQKKAAAGELSLDDLSLADLEREYRAAQQQCSADKRGLETVRKFDLGPKAEAELEEQVAGAEEALAAAKETLVKLQSGDAATVAIWQRIADITIDECMRLVERLHANVTAEHTAGESTYRDELGGVVEDVVSKGIAEESEGALVVKLDDAGIKEPLLVRKSDGGFLYATTDLAAVRRRVQELGGDLLVYAVDSRQSLHFKQVFAAAQKAGYATRDGADAQLVHAMFGSVLGEDNRPFKTRSGENVALKSLVDEAVERADRAVREKNPDLSDAERAKVAAAVGVGAVKYADLSSDRVKDYVFSFDRMLAFEGNTGPYLQYALVRIRSIFRKAESDLGLTRAWLDGDGADTLGATEFDLSEPAERALALQALRFEGVLHAVARSFEPHRLTTYLYELATTFSSFFEACPVLKAPDEATRNSRLRLCRVTERVLESGLETLGIEALEKM